MNHRIIIVASLLAFTTAVYGQGDTVPPDLTDFDFNPKSVDVSAGAAGVVCTMTVTDSPSGVDRMECSIRHPVHNQEQKCWGSLVSGDQYDGVWECTVTIPQYAAEGTWNVLYVRADDNAGNYHVYYTSELDQLGFPTQLEVISNEDLWAPDLTDFDFNPKSVDVSAGAAGVVCTMTVTDSPSGVDRMECSIRHPVHNQEQKCWGSLVSGDQYDGVWECTVTIPQGAAGGTWNVLYVRADDNAGNYHVYYTSELDQLGFPTQLEVISNEDLWAPDLTDFDFNPKSVDVSAGAAGVVCTMTVTDSPSGVDRMECSIRHPVHNQEQKCWGSLVSGDQYDGVWECTVTIPQYAAEGTWNVLYVRADDNAGNYHVYYTSELDQLGFPTTLQVGFLDGSPITTISSPKDGQSIRGNSVTIRARLVQGSPVDVSPTLGIRFDHRALPFGNFAPVLARNPNHPNPDTTYPYFIHWDVSSVADGDYELRAVAHDLAGNPDPSPETITITIDHGGPADVDENENASGLQESRTAVDDSVESEAESGDHVNASTATELIVPAGALTLANDIAVLLHLDSVDEIPRLEQPEQNVGSFVEVSLDSGQTDFEGGVTSELNISYSDHNQDGVVDGTSVREDELELRYYDAGSDSYLRASGWIVMTEHNMVHGDTASTGRFALTGPLQPKIWWEADRITLTWDAVSEAASYNVYRGNLGDLIDTDADGLPDSGYGDCMNHLDPDTTDTVFVENELPTHPVNGFFYIASFVGPQGESTLGNTKAGLRREVFSPCP